MCTPQTTNRGDREGGIGRRRILAAVAAIAAAVVLENAARGAAPVGGTRPPNLLYIMTDQQHAGMMSCAGNKYLRTPAMDSLAATGARFARAYATNPVCLPARVSMMTGQMPSRFGIRSNATGGIKIADAVLKQSMGWMFREAGYDTAYGGKTHWPTGMTPESLGFRRLSGDSRDVLADECARFIRTGCKKPFLLVASFINPHDICYMAIDDFTRATNREPMYPTASRERECLAAALRLPEDVSREEFFQRFCPPLPANYPVPPLEPQCITTEYLQTRAFREHARNTWPDEKWRLHRWAYCRLTEMVDSQVGKVLDALRQAGLEEETVIIFASDHGDMDAAHRLEHKSVLYEESVRVPFMVSYQGVTRPGLIDDVHLVSVGLDLIPTLCDYAGIEPPRGLPGRSVRALAEGRPVPSWRDRLVAESQAGRMLRTARYKYNVYESGEHREQLIDLENDPGEMVNLAEVPKYEQLLNRHRELLRHWVEETGDRIARPHVPSGRE